MGFLTGGEKWKKYGDNYTFMSIQEQNNLRDMEFGRNLLSNIRQARLARSELAFSNFSDDAMVSSSYGATANIDSTLAGEYVYAIDTSRKLEQIQNLSYLAKESYEKAATMDRRAGTAGQIIGGLTTAIGFAVGGPVGGAIGGAIGAGTTSALGGGNAAVQGAISGGVNTWTDMYSSYNMQMPTSNKQPSAMETGGTRSYASWIQDGRRYYVSDQGYGSSNIRGLMS